MSASPEKGNGWEITRGFITPSYAERLGEQGMSIIDEDSDHIMQYPPRDIELAEGVAIYEAEHWYDPGSDNNPGADYLHETAPDLMAVATEIMLSRTGDVDDKIILNLYDPEGVIKLHVDNKKESINRSVVGLFGPRIFWIRDLATFEWHSFEMEPGDRADIDNSGPQHPPHFAINPSKTEPSLSLVK